MILKKIDWKKMYLELMLAIQKADQSQEDWRKVLSPTLKAHSKELVEAKKSS